MKFKLFKHLGQSDSLEVFLFFKSCLKAFKIHSTFDHLSPTEVECHPPRNETNHGTTVCTRGYHYGSVCRTFCYPGFGLLDLEKEYATCDNVPGRLDHYGEWTNEPAVCTGQWSLCLLATMLKYTMCGMCGMCCQNCLKVSVKKAVFIKFFNFFSSLTFYICFISIFNLFLFVCVAQQLGKALKQLILQVAVPHSL